MKTSFKKVIAGLASGAIALTQFAGMAVAYTDVDLTSGVWYGAATQAMLDGGFLDASQTALRPGDNAKRAEFFTLVSRLQGGPIISAPAVSTFADVQSGDYFYLTLHDLAADGTLKGDNNCVETGATPCFAGPGRDISRAEAAATIVRAFNLASLGEADAFADVDASAWYAADLATAADHCVVQGKSNGLADPAAPMNRAEMITMLYRVDLNMTYAGGCDEPMMGKINNAVATSLSMVEVDFSMDVDATMGADASMYCKCY